MSYGSEYMDEYAYERDQAIEMLTRAENNVRHGLWITKYGRYLHVSEMETNHIRNCTKMLERNNSPFKDVYIPMFEKELAKRGDTE
jgi:hypothetical protein